VQFVVARTAVEDVLAAAADQCVVAVFAGEIVVTGCVPRVVALEQVVARAAEQGIVAALAVEPVIAVSPVKKIPA